MKTLRTLLVPLDGSEASATAVDYAVWLAQNQGAEIAFCHSIDLAGAMADCIIPYGVGDIGPLVGALEDQCKALLAKAQAKAAEGRVPCITVELTGPPAGSIVEAAAQRGISAIVMGKIGRDGAGRFLLGSVTEGVLRQSEVPVFAIAHAQPANNTEFPVFAHIVIAVDDSKAADAAVDFARNLADPERTIVEVVHVLDADPEPTAAARAAAEKLIEAAALRLRENGLHVEETIVQVAPVDEIVRLAEQRCTDLIVIGTHGRSGLRRFFLGSVAEHVLRSAHVPLAIVRRSLQPQREPDVASLVAQPAG